MGEFFLEQIEQLRAAKRTGYAQSHYHVYNSLMRFNGHLDIYFSDIDIPWLKKYEEWQRGNGDAENSIGIRFRTLRVVYNHAIEENIVKACERAGRERSEITLVAVSKTKPVSMLSEIYECGVRDFGENKVQEICEKRDLLPSDIRWHMIGHLQRNKVKYIVNDTTLIHSVDSYRLAEEINVQAKKINRIIPILIEINIADESSKFGIAKEEALQLAEEISHLDGIQIRGLMTIAPYVENPEENRPYFKKIRELAVDIAKENIDNVSMDILSMGMTGDYAVAIEEGATIVRVGTGIFGSRN